MPKIFPGASVYTPPSSVNVLSFHGGGYRGYFSALVAQALERRKASLGDRRPLAQSFDLLCGTSAGSIIAAGLAANVPISAIVTMMREKGPDIFPERRFLKTKPGFFGSRFASNNLKNALIATLGDIRLGALEKALLIPTVNETDGQPVVFRSYDPSQSDIRLVDVIFRLCRRSNVFSTAPHRRQALRRWWADRQWPGTDCRVRSSCAVRRASEWAKNPQHRNNLPVHAKRGSVIIQRQMGDHRMVFQV